MTDDGSGPPRTEGPATPDDPGPIVSGVELASRYRVDRAIGRGGMALVYHGHDTLLDRDVAIKVLGSIAATATGSQREFLREARAAAALSHPNIAGVYDAGVHGNERYIVMEYIPGGSLFDLIQMASPLPIDRAVELATQIADALDYGHRRGIIHCDVKPQNVLLDDMGRPKLVDFGISRSIASTGALTDMITGTAGYIAPEQLQGDRIDGRVDIYALGCLTYEMLSGDLPFDAPNLTALATQRLVRPPIPLSQRNPGLPTPLVAAVMAALEREPDERYATAREFAAALVAARKAIDEQSTSRFEQRPPRVAPEPVALVRPVRERVPTRQVERQQPADAPPPRRHLFWPLTLLVLGLLVVLGAYLALQAPGLLGRGSASVAVPSVLNQSIGQAATALHAQGLNVSVQLKDTTGAACTGQVLKQAPPPGTQLRDGQTVTLDVSQNPGC